MGLIIALDPPEGVDGVRWCLRIAERLGRVPSGYKLGLPLLVREGVKGFSDVVSVIKSDLIIADLKLADIGYVNSLIVKEVSRTGVNAVIAHAFIGVEGGLDELAETCRSLGIKLILVTLMSHPGASRVMSREFREMLGIVKEVGAWGAVLPATMPEAIRAGRELLGGDVKILSPGIGPQGARPGDAICAGADYEIVGRLITLSEDPLSTALKVIEEQGRRVRECRCGGL